MISILKKFFKNSSGSVTLEATILLPMLLLIFFSLIFYAMHLYQKLVMLDAATYTVTQAAANWDNRNKDIESGILPVNANDGLYWRILRDPSGIAGTTGNAGSIYSLDKITYAKSFLQGRMEPGLLRLSVSSKPEVTVAYDKGISRKVTASVNSNILTPVSPLVRPMMGDRVEIAARADVAEPVEFIRNCDLASKYLKDLVSLLDKFGDEDVKKPPEIKVIASTYSYDLKRPEKLFHLPGCTYLKQVKQSQTFDSMDKAEAVGYHPCTKCFGRDLLNDYN